MPGWPKTCPWVPPFAGATIWRTRQQERAMAEIAVDYDGLIPNNVGLNADPRLRRALENWHPTYLDWWKSRGPDGFQDNLVYLRTAVGVDQEGWAKFGYVRMPEYRWGILLTPP